MKRFRAVSLDVMTTKVICNVCDSADARLYIYPDGERSLCKAHEDDYCNTCGADLAGEESVGLFDAFGDVRAVVCNPCAQ
jgi:hypothetical protein